MAIMTIEHDGRVFSVNHLGVVRDGSRVIGGIWRPSPTQDVYRGWVQGRPTLPKKTISYPSRIEAATAVIRRALQR